MRRCLRDGSPASAAKEAPRRFGPPCSAGRAHHSGFRLPPQASSLAGVSLCVWTGRRQWGSLPPESTGVAMRQDIVTFDRDEQGELFNMSFPYPDPEQFDPVATERQLAAVADFFCFEPDSGFTGSQAHALLTVRDYGRAAAERLYPRLDGLRRALLARFVAAYLCAAPTAAADVSRWFDRRWDADADQDGLVAAISRTKHFRAVEAFLQAVILDLRDFGSTAL